MEERATTKIKLKLPPGQMILDFRSVVYLTNWTGFRGAGQSQ